MALQNEERVYAEIGKHVCDILNGFKQLTEKPQETVITDEMYETERQKRALRKLVSELHKKDKRIKVDYIADLTGKCKAWFSTVDGLKMLPLRNTERNTRKRPDVIKFLCDLWNYPYPPELKDYCRKHVEFENLLAA